MYAFGKTDSNFSRLFHAVVLMQYNSLYHLAWPSDEFKFLTAYR